MFLRPSLPRKKEKNPRQALRHAGRAGLAGRAPGWLCWVLELTVCSFESFPPGGTWAQVLTQASQTAYPDIPRAVHVPALSRRLWSFSMSCLGSLVVFVLSVEDVESVIDMTRVCGRCGSCVCVCVCVRACTHTLYRILHEIFLFWVISRLPWLKES